MKIYTNSQDYITFKFKKFVLNKNLIELLKSVRVCCARIHVTGFMPWHVYCQGTVFQEPVLPSVLLKRQGLSCSAV